MIHLQGAILGPVSDGGFCALQQAGAYAPKMLEMVPGVKWSKQWGKYYIPANLIPANLSALDKPKVRRTPSGLILRPYQSQTVDFIAQAVRGVLVGLDMGLGKTMSIIQHLHENSRLRPFLICGPVIAEGAWCGENSDPTKHYGMTVAPLHTRSPNDEKFGATGQGSPDGYFMTYEVVDDWNLWISHRMQPKVLVMDEAHELRNPRRRTSKAVKALSRESFMKLRIAATGTPVINTISDLWNILDILQPGAWGPWVTHPGYKTSFRQRYLGAHLSDEGWWIDEGEINVDELRMRLSSVMIRRSRFDVRKDLPQMWRQVTEITPQALEPTAYADYKENAKSVYAALKQQSSLKAQAQLLEEKAKNAAEVAQVKDEQEKIDVLAKMNAHEIRRLGAMASKLSWAKRKLAVEKALTMARSFPSRKLVVFCYYQDTAKYIAKALKREKQLVYGPVTGGTTIKRRLKLAEQFRDVTDDTGNRCSFYVATLKAAGQALNPLSAAGGELFVDMYWVPYLFLQAEARVHREGQTAEAVYIEYLVLRNSIDTIMWEHLLAKAKAIEAGTRDGEALKFCEELGGKNEKEGQKALLEKLAGLDLEELELL